MVAVMDIALLLERLRDAFLADKNSLVGRSGSLPFWFTNDIEMTFRVGVAIGSRPRVIRTTPTGLESMKFACTMLSSPLSTSTPRIPVFLPPLPSRPPAPWAAILSTRTPYTRLNSLVRPPLGPLYFGTHGAQTAGAEACGTCTVKELYGVMSRVGSDLFPDGQEELEALAAQCGIMDGCVDGRFCRKQGTA